MVRHACAKRLAPAQPISEVAVTICYGSGIVVRGVERLPIHRAVNIHVVLRQCCNWYIAQALFGSLHAAQATAGCVTEWIACQIRCGVAGMSRCVMPYGDSASTTAFITVAGEAIVPTSPHPLTPSGLCRQRVLSVATVIGGKSSARGIW